jgi:antitoxin HicB
MRYAYPAELLEAPDGVTITFPDVPGAISQGASRQDAMARGAEALVSMLAALVEDGEPIPRPSPARGRARVSVSALEAAKLALHDAVLRAGITNAELARRLGVTEKAVRRLRDPLHRSHIGSVEAALRALGARLVVEAELQAA